MARGWNFFHFLENCLSSFTAIKSTNGTQELEVGGCWLLLVLGPSVDRSSNLLRRVRLSPEVLSVAGRDWPSRQEVILDADGMRRTSIFHCCTWRKCSCW